MTASQAQSMLAASTRHRSAAAMFRLANFMHACAHRTSAAGLGVEAWLERRRVAKDALQDLGRMSERELFDIGLTRVDVKRVAWGESIRPRTSEGASTFRAPHVTEGQALVRCAIFLHLAYAGGVICAVALLMFLADEMAGRAALALMLFGVVLALWSWWRARTVLFAVYAGSETESS